MPPFGQCAPTTLSNGTLLRIEYCKNCGVFSLHFGAITLRLDRTACESVEASISEALTRLSELEEARVSAHAGCAREDPKVFS